MTLQDFLYLSLSIGFLILVAFFSFAAYNLALVLKRLRHILENAEDITEDVAKLKNSLKYGIFSIISSFINKKRR